MSTSGTMSVRGYELHGDRMWNWAWVGKSLDVMEELGLNALVFHRNDLLDLLVLPSSLFSVSEMLSRWPIRYHSMISTRHYLRRVISHAHARGIAFYIQTKEISFADGLIEKVPQVRINGVLCATHPFWPAFLETKVRETLTALPELDGLIVSLGTHESKVSIAANACTCRRCLETSAVDWYASQIGSMHGPLSAQNKTLAVRDFSFGRSGRDAIVAGATAVSTDIVVSLKNTPHDFFPTFPTNDRIGKVGAHPQWVEFDVWGEFFGMGVFPCMIVDDLKQRLDHCRASGVTGVITRTGGETIANTGVLDTLNQVNLRGFSALAQNATAETTAVLENFLLGPVTTVFADGGSDTEFSLADYPHTRAAVSDAFIHSWAVIAGAIFMQGHVFHEDCMFPDSIAHAYQVMTEVHSLTQWRPESQDALDLRRSGTLGRILAEKDAACDQARRIRSAVSTALSQEKPPEAIRSQLEQTFDLQVWYVDGFRVCARACLKTQVHLNLGTPMTLDDARGALLDLVRFIAEIRSRLVETDYPAVVRYMLDVSRLEALARDVSIQLAQ